MFNKLDMIDNQPVLTKFIDLRHNDVISDVTVDLFQLEQGCHDPGKPWNFSRPWKSPGNKPKSPGKPGNWLEFLF